jgi:26S proteasome regulatory subunit N2
MNTNSVLQPTGGVILLHDTQPDEPKSLLELKVKKARVQPAPAAATAAAAAVLAAASGEAAMRDAEEEAAAENGGADVEEEGYVLDDGVEGEAEVPGDFEYESDGEGGNEDAMEE